MGYIHRYSVHDFVCFIKVLNNIHKDNKNKHNQNSFKVKYSVCTPLSRCNCRKHNKYINT